MMKDAAGHPRTGREALGLNGHGLIITSGTVGLLTVCLMPSSGRRSISLRDARPALSLASRAMDASAKSTASTSSAISRGLRILTGHLSVLGRARSSRSTITLSATCSTDGVPASSHR